MGGLITLDLSNPENLHFDHAYAGTAHALQGITVEQVSLSLQSDQRYLANQKTFLVAISRSTSNVGIYTDNRARLLERLTHNRGDKTSSIEVMGKSGQDKLNPVMVERNDAKRLSNLSKSVTQSISQYDYSALLQDRLRQSLPSLLEKLMVAEPRRKTQQHYYYGHNQGSLAVSISGEKQGLWYDFQTGKGGNMLQLIQEKLGLDFKQALDYVAQHLGLPQENLKLSKTKSATPSIISTQKRHFNQNEQARIRYAQILTAQSKAITGTLAEQYLRVHRGIQGALPDSLRYHPHVYSKVNATVAPALLAVATNQQGQIQAVQAIFLNPATGTKANIAIQKQTFGVLKGASVTLQTKAHQASSFIFYAEGPETGLSVLETFPHAKVEVLLGAANFKHIPHQQSVNHIILCLDNDKDNTTISKMYHQVAESLTQAGKQAWLAQPSLPGYDFNNVLINQGQLAVYKNIAHAQLYTQVQPRKILLEMGNVINQLGNKAINNPAARHEKPNCLSSRAKNKWVGNQYNRIEST